MYIIGEYVIDTRRYLCLFRSARAKLYSGKYLDKFCRTVYLQTQILFLKTHFLKIMQLFTCVFYVNTIYIFCISIKIYAYTTFKFRFL